MGLPGSLGNESTPERAETSATRAVSKRPVQRTSVAFRHVLASLDPAINILRPFRGFPATTAAAMATVLVTTSGLLVWALLHDPQVVTRSSIPVVAGALVLLGVMSARFVFPSWRLRIDGVRVRDTRKDISNEAQKFDATALVKAPPLADAGSARSVDRRRHPRMERKAVLTGVLASGFLIANTAKPSAAAAATPTYVPTWTPSTDYALGQQVISPNNDVVSANVAHTSSAAYSTDTAKWDLSTTLNAAIANAASSEGSAYKPSLPRQATPKMTPIATWQNGHGWKGLSWSGGTWNLNDTSDYVIGSQCVSGTTSGTGVLGAVRHAALTSFSLATNDVQLWVKVTGLAHLLKIEATFGSGGFAAYFQANLYDSTLFSASNRQIRDGEWFPFRFNLADLPVNVGSPGAATLTDVQFGIQDDNTSNSVTVKFGGFFIYPRASAFPNGVVSLTFDDGYLSQYTYAAAKMAAYGWTGTAYLIIDQIGGGSGGYSAMNLTQIQALQNTYGWEIGVHANTKAHHDAGLDTLSSTELIADLSAAKQFLIDNQLASGVDHLAYPLGNHSPSTDAVVTRFFATGRTLAWPNMEVVQPGAPIRLRAALAGGSADFPSLQGEVTRAVNNGGWLIIILHDFVSGAPSGDSMTQTDFATLLASIDTAGIPVRPVGDVWRQASV
jgi:peptidoglycan/xylan/chitin deacetylase (PgdA/CDA1 family)